MTVTAGDRRSIALLLESDGPGGAERMLLHLAEELRQRGHEICPIGPANGCGWLAAEFRSRGFEPEAFALRHPLDWGCVRSLLDIFRRRRIELAHSHEFTMAVYGAAAAQRAKIPHLITMHGGTAFAARWRRRLAVRWAFRASQSVVTVSEPSRTELARSLGIPLDRIQVVPNGIAFESGQRQRVRAELGLSDEDVLVLAIGNLYPVKGHALLLHALASRRDLAWRLAIAGRGDEERALRGFAESEGLADRIHLLGYRSDIPDLLAAADVFVMPSLSEGLPLALIEAMFAQKAIIASTVGGIPYVIESGTHGLLVSPGDSEELAVALERLLSSGPERLSLGRAALARASESFHVRLMADAYEMLYNGGAVGVRV